ncbi:sensor domain-containing diguanylate cyclase [Halanaerobium praevalens]|uniref:Diguanylate cyclase n=1 Tax=Halanaerobium praevalens (strain ATCC 33744 / DSM 2228 / GSL) TaxID=572479 RepID=E3DMU6_HALPG|nr:sensor domain-containing diguanylate cyclase [Halanaerobium praevalens]ADO77435.1 diguanylate cyclase [Halanaerobium praevalens DSM 2228]
MLNHLKRKEVYSSLILTILIFILLFLPLSLYLSNIYKDFLLEKQRLETQKQLNYYTLNLNNQLNERFSLLTGLEAFVKNNWEESINQNNFINFTNGLYFSTSGIRNFIIAPEGINQYVYPLNNNQESIGHNLLKDQRIEVQKDIKKTLTTKKLIVSGPYKLRQGGLGIILRKALFRNSNFWGLITMALDLTTIYKNLGLDNPNLMIDLAIKSDGNIFFGKKNIFNSNPVVNELKFKNKKIEIGAIPNQGWDNSIKENNRTFNLLLIFINFLILIIIYSLSYREQKIKYIVTKKTRDLKEKNKILNQKKEIIKYQAFHDQLTELYNRRFFEEKLKNMDNKEQLPVSVIIADVNGLKIMNDTYGHHFGDELLQKIAKILKSVIREEDVLARWGGDEFALLLPNTNLKEAKEIVKRIKTITKRKKCKDLSISVAIGLAVKNKAEQNIYEIIKKADNKMYQDKKNGR